MSETTKCGKEYPNASAVSVTCGLKPNHEGNHVSAQGGNLYAWFDDERIAALDLETEHEQIADAAYMKGYANGKQVAEAALREATGCLERIAKWRIGEQSPAVIAQGFLDRGEK